MIYIYDILLNFCDSDFIYDFYEWGNNDEIENIKRIKLVAVGKEIFNQLLYYDGIVAEDFLLKIYRTCEVYTSKRVKVLEYCSLFSDGERVLAIEFDKNGRPIYKSKLLIDEEEEIAVLAINLEVMNMSYTVKKPILKERFLTRNEITIRKYLMKEIEESYRSKNFDKLKFLYFEYYDQDDDSCSYKQMSQNLINSMKLSLDDKHLNLYKLLRLTNKKKQV